MHGIATAISDEARAKHHEFVRRGERGLYQGLTFWSPNINIFRDPRWGRGQETYGEDPFLTARMGVAFVKGLQGDDPEVLEDGRDREALRRAQRPEADRHTSTSARASATCTRPTCPRSRRSCRRRKVASVMGAYNRVNGESASPARLLLQTSCASDWGFQGYVVSDCGSIDDIYKGTQDREHGRGGGGARRSSTAATSSAARRLRALCPRSSKA